MVKNSSSVKTEEYYIASMWKLVWRKFKKHKLAMVGVTILAILYIALLFCEFFSTMDPTQRTNNLCAPPQRIRFVSDEGFQLRPFVYGFTKSIDDDTWKRVYEIDKTKKYNISFFTRGSEYKMWGLFKTNIHIIGVNEGHLHLLGTDVLGRDMYSRIVYSIRISLSIGLISVAMSFILGCILGGISGYYGGAIDTFIQRLIEFLKAIPTLPLWMALSVAMPPSWSPIMVYFCILMILALKGWTSLARTVRGKLLELREADFVMAAKVCGTSDRAILTRHLLPSFMSYLIVNITLTIPSVILGETALSYLGLGLRPPVISLGVLIKNAQNVETIGLYPWLMIPVFFVIVTVLAFNFVGDGLRDAADPYK